MKFYAVFKTMVEEHVLLDVDNWQDAAHIASSMKSPVVQAELPLSVVAMCDCSGSECDCGYYDSVHELIGPCNKCSFQILERGCTDACKDRHQHSPSDPNYKKGGGWVSTKHGHVTWCSQACREADKVNDPEVGALDRLSGV